MVNTKMIGRRFVALSCLLLGVSVSANDAKSVGEEPDFQSIFQEALNKIHDDYVDHFAFREQVTRRRGAPALACLLSQIHIVPESKGPRI